MRVLCVGNMYPPHSEGGYELVCQGAVRALRAAGHHARVLVSDARGPAATDAAEPDADVHRELHGYWRGHELLRPLGPRARLRLECHNAAVLDRHLARFEPDVVAWWAMGGLSLGLVERVAARGLPAVAFVGDDWLVYGRVADQWARLGRQLGPARRIVERLTAQPMGLRSEESVAWLFVSDALRRSARAAGWRLDRARVVPHGVTADFRSETDLHGWNGELLCAGRIDPRKGIDAAIRGLAETSADARLTVVGHGSERHLGELQRLSSELGLSERVRFQSGRDHSDMPAVYAAHDAVLFPVRWAEPWGLVPLEAMAVGRPVVASGRGGSAEYLRDGDNCLLADPDRPASIGEAIDRLASDAELRSRIVASGRATAAEHSAAAFEALAVQALVDARDAA